MAPAPGMGHGHHHASPWGMGGILSVDGRPAAYFATRVSDHDLVVFSAKRGESGFTTTWEMLAILIAARTWARPEVGPLHIRSDSLASLSATARMASSAPGMSIVLRELALLEAGNLFQPASLTHIPGVANDWADALSRLSAPEPRTLPPALAACPRARVPPRAANWYRSLADPARQEKSAPLAPSPSPLRSPRRRPRRVPACGPRPRLGCRRQPLREPVAQIAPRRSARRAQQSTPSSLAKARRLSCTRLGSSCPLPPQARCMATGSTAEL